MLRSIFCCTSGNFHRNRFNCSWLALITLLLCNMHIPILYAAPLINGGVVSEAISIPGKQDSYTFSANAGESVEIRVADINNSSLAPQLKLISPSGAVLFNTTGTTVAVIGLTVSSSGTYTVVVADGTQGHAQTGNYNLYFARMPGANEGGTLPHGDVVSGVIDIGDLDSYTFTANVGETAQIQVTDTGNSSYVPQLKLFSPSGAVIINTSGPSVASFTYPVASSGTYTIIVADGTAGDGLLTGCHRSTRAYATYIRDPGTFQAIIDRSDTIFDFLACSGAVTDNVTASGQGQNDEPPQLSPSNGINASRDLVTITIGGNDAFFVDILKYCFAHNACNQLKPFDPHLDIELGDLFTQLWIPVVKTRLVNLQKSKTRYPMQQPL